MEMIPEGWNMTRLRNFVHIREDRVSSIEIIDDTLCIELEDIEQASGRLIGRQFSSRVSTKYCFCSGDVLFGRLRPYLRKWWLADQSGVCSTEIWPLVSDPLVADCRFIFGHIQADTLYEAAQVSYGTHMPRADWSVVSSVSIPLPPLSEQRAIATVLADMDALIGSLEDLIAKKWAIKRAAMQQLLAGRTRLLGFEGEWETRRLGDLAHITTGRRNNEQKCPNGKYPFFVRSSFVEKINSFSYDCEAILVPGDGRIGRIIHYTKGRFDVHQRVYVISDFSPSLIARFLYFYMAEFFGTHAIQLSVRATVDSLRLPTFERFPVFLPPLPEQRAIAAVLSDMDAEIAALERRLEKTRAIKRGMMQQLLTGAVRLPIPDESLKDGDDDA